MLTAAVTEQLVADRPVRTFLSGGVDSALIAHLARLLAGASCEGREPAPPPAWLLRLTLGDGGRAWAGWSAGAPVEVALPARPARVLDRDGEELPPPDGVRVRLDGSPRFFLSPPERGGGEP